MNSEFASKLCLALLLAAGAAGAAEPIVVSRGNADVSWSGAPTRTAEQCEAMAADPRPDPCDVVQLRVDATPGYWGDRIGGVLIRVYGEPVAGTAPPLPGNFDVYVYRLDAMGRRGPMAARSDHWLHGREAVGLLRATGDYELHVVSRSGTASRYTAHAEFIEPEHWTPRIGATALGLICNEDNVLPYDRTTEDQGMRVGGAPVFVGRDTCEDFVGSFYSHDGMTLSSIVFMPRDEPRPRPLLLELLGGVGAAGGSRCSAKPLVNSSGAADCTNAALGSAQWFRDRRYFQASFSRRGAFGSCGAAPVATNTFQETASGPGGDPTCERGWTPWLDRATEVGDMQQVLGTLVDYGLADPGRLGAFGGSYAGGTVQLLATSPPWAAPVSGRRLQAAAIASIRGFSDLHDFFAPNGRETDESDQASSHFEPYGIFRQESTAPLLGAGGGWRTNTWDPSDHASYWPAWEAFWAAGEPYDTSSVGGVTAQYMADVFRAKSAYHADGFLAAVAEDPAAAVPLFLYQGYEDNFFPAVQALQLYRKLKAVSAEYPVWLYFDNSEHSDPVLNGDPVSAAIKRFFAAYLDGATPGSDRVVSAGSGGEPLQAAASWDALKHEAAVVLTARGSRVTTSRADVEGLTDQPGQSVPELPADPAVWTWPAPTGGFTLLGLPKVSLDYEFLHGGDATVFAELSLVAADGTDQKLANRDYRLVATGAGARGTLRMALDGKHRFVPEGHALQLRLSQHRVGEKHARPNVRPSVLRWSAAKVEVPAVEDLETKVASIERVSGHGVAADLLVAAGLPSVVPGHTASFHFAVTAGGPPKGHLRYDDAAAGTSIKAHHFTTLKVSGNRAVLAGRGDVNGAEDQAFVLELEDNGTGGSLPDRLSIKLEGLAGYVNSGLVTQGDVVVDR